MKRTSDDASARFDAALDAYRRRAVPPEAPDLRASLMARFDRDTRARRFARRAFRWSHPLAAAAVVLLALWLAPFADRGSVDADRGSPPVARAPIEPIAPPAPPLAERIAALERRVDALLAATEPRAEPEAAPAPGALADPIAAIAVRRLASARVFEPLDPDGAAHRYRAVVAQFPGPAAAVARDRLVALAR